MSMISLFDKKGNGMKDDARDAYLARLKAVLGEEGPLPMPPPLGITPLPSASSPPAAESQVSASPRTTVVPNRNRGEDTLSTPIAQLGIEPADNGSPKQFERLVQQMASEFAESFVFAFREVGAQQTQTRDLTVTVSKLSERVDGLSAGLTAQAREIEAVAPRLAASDERLGEGQRLGAAIEERLRRLEQKIGEQQEAIQQQITKISDGLAQTGGSVHTLAELAEGQARAHAETREVTRKFHETQQSFQDRLDVHAEAIRLIHSVAEECHDRFRQLEAALERAREVFAAISAAKSLPDRL